MRRWITHLAVLSCIAAISSAEAATCADRLMARTVADLDLHAIRARLDHDRIATITRRGRERLTEQIDLAARISRQRDLRAGDYARLIRDAGLYRGTKSMLFRDTKRMLARDRYISRTSKAYAAALAEAVDVTREVRQRLLTAVLMHGHEQGDWFFATIADGPEFASDVLTHLGKMARELPALTQYIERLMLTASVPPSPNVGYDEERRRAVATATAIGQLLDAIISAYPLTPAPYGDTDFKPFVRSVLIHPSDAWDQMLRPGQGTPSELRVMHALLTRLKLDLPRLETHYASLRDALNERRTEVLLRLEDLVGSPTAAAAE